ncbi:MAG: rhodanese-like domain-containing protein [Candidatus Eremiobacteraeota bacterium]|nr:rhodanese-like domain-containing protein [Candidatus Eremiobacteraeota bacterium]
MAEITCDELARWRSERSDFAIIDVREPWELQMSSLADATNVPMRQLAGDTSVVPQDRDVVLICRSGSRTDMLAEHLGTLGFTNIYSLEGGLNEWARRIDTSMKQY